MKFWDNKRKTRRAIWKRKGGLRKLFFPDGRGIFYGFETIAVFRGMCADRIVQWCCESSVFYTAECEQGDKISGGYSGNAAFWEASQKLNKTSIPLGILSAVKHNRLIDSVL